MGGERAAIMELDATSHQEPIAELVGRDLHRPRSETVQGIGLVLGACNQAREGDLHALGGIALKDKAVEGIEGERVLIENSRRRNMREHSALRGVRIDIIELLEVRRIFEVPKR
jgi:hypothetical protein